MKRHRLLIAFAAIAAALVLVVGDVGDASARAGRGFSGGSRGMRTFSAPPVTRTAPNAARPMERTLTQPGRTGTAFGQTGARPGFFGRGLFGGLAGGFLGAGLFGLLFGYGFFGGMAGFASLLGLLLQVVLIVVVARLVMAWWQRRNAPAYAGAAGSGSGGGHAFTGFASAFGANEPSSAPLTVEKADYDAFERLLGDVQAAYSAEDVNALRAHVTPEMLSYFSEEFASNASRGVVNRVSDVKLLQGDLSEAWRDGDADYATVAMRFALDDRMVERASGRTVENNVGEVTELWTFRRTRGGDWLLSAIQQT